MDGWKEIYVHEGLLVVGQVNISTQVCYSFMFPSVQS